MKLKPIHTIFCFLFIVGCSPNKNILKSDPIPEPVPIDKFMSEQGQFSIQFDQYPTTSTSNIPLESGQELLLTSYTFSKGINYIFCVSYVDYPAQMKELAIPDNFMLNMLEVALDVQRAGLEKEKKVQVDKYPGLEFQYSNGDLFVIGRYVLMNNRLFQITVTKESDYPPQAEVDRFIQSFEIIKEA